MKININILLLTLLTGLFMGCHWKEDKAVTATEPSAKSDVTETEIAEEISFSPIVCSYSIRPTCWTVVDCITTKIEIRDDNTVAVFCSDFQDRIDSETLLTLDYIYGETFSITEEQKQNLITIIKKNKIYEIKDCGDEDSCDGSNCFLYLYDANGEIVHSCGGLNPYGNEFETTVTAIMEILPEDTLKNVKNKATEHLTQYLLEKYPEQYDWLEEE